MRLSKQNTNYNNQHTSSSLIFQVKKDILDQTSHQAMLALRYMIARRDNKIEKFFEEEVSEVFNKLGNQNLGTVDEEEIGIKLTTFRENLQKELEENVTIFVDLVQSNKVDLFYCDPYRKDQRPIIYFIFDVQRYDLLDILIKQQLSNSKNKKSEELLFKYEAAKQNKKSSLNINLKSDNVIVNHAPLDENLKICGQ